jgi:putative Mg2+ transporter-C (MgtC) family protein
MPQEFFDIAVKLASAWLAGSLIGLERTVHGRPAGFRTHALVCVASALLMLVTTYQWNWLGGAPQEIIRTDPTRIAQGIMTGIGFLGAGVIFKEGLTVRGLTTAASIWITASLGILYGIGMYYPAVLGTLITIAILALFRWFEDKVPGQFYAHHTLRFARDKTPPEDEVRRLLRKHGFSVANLSYRLRKDGTVFEYRTVIRSANRENAARLAEELRNMENVLEFQISPTGD